MREQRILLGSMQMFTPHAMAERAIYMAGEHARSPKARFMLIVSPDRRVWMYRNKVRFKQSDWRATFTRESDPDWLADELEAA